eukprot:CAMPEP_0115676840 /NCGR_PEP_ID=MMETSP0272-20121206/54905_1 /TAXON_ID=71861 /ORGANISM="Scrippsiella trochoidea, Strain CCMP3099" /LENGTH=230 /DNA_ID=CAMNT_0003115915 /DNA_START=25 /DNA_END=719 /DNA_ORIENTATION=+
MSDPATSVRPMPLGAAAARAAAAAGASGSAGSALASAPPVPKSRKPSQILRAISSDAAAWRASVRSETSRGAAPDPTAILPQSPPHFVARVRDEFTSAAVCHKGHVALLLARHEGREQTRQAFDHGLGDGPRARFGHEHVRRGHVLINVGHEAKDDRPEQAKLSMKRVRPDMVFQLLLHLLVPTADDHQLPMAKLDEPFADGNSNLHQAAEALAAAHHEHDLRESGPLQL